MTSRTTIRNIDPDILWDAKIYAAQTKQRLGDVVSEAVQNLIAESDMEDAVEHSDDQEHSRAIVAAIEAIQWMK